MNLTKEQIQRQDFVDNLIFDLLQELNPSSIKIDWDIEMIGEVRDCIESIFNDKFSISEEKFYPHIKENGN